MSIQRERATASDSPKLQGAPPAFSSSELNAAQHGLDRLSACMLSLQGQQYPLVPGEKKKKAKAVKGYGDDGEVNHVRCKMLFPFLKSCEPQSFNC